jgi:hypothetical protein
MKRRDAQNTRHGTSWFIELRHFDVAKPKGFTLEGEFVKMPHPPEHPSGLPCPPTFSEITP